MKSAAPKNPEDLKLPYELISKRLRKLETAFTRSCDSLRQMIGSAAVRAGASVYRPAFAKYTQELTYIPNILNEATVIAQLRNLEDQPCQLIYIPGWDYAGDKTAKVVAETIKSNKEIEAVCLCIVSYDSL